MIVGKYVSIACTCNNQNLVNWVACFPYGIDRTISEDVHIYVGTYIGKISTKC